MFIPEIQLVLKPIALDAEKIIGFKWAVPKIGKRSKLGESPDWIQLPEVPNCTCGKEMIF